MFYRLKLKDWGYLTILVILTYLWITYDQLIFPESYQRMVAFSVLGLFLMTSFYFLVKPLKPFKLSNTMTIVLIPLFIVLSVVLHLFIFKDGFQTKSILLWFITAGMIYLSGFFYRIFHKK